MNYPKGITEQELFIERVNSFLFEKVTSDEFRRLDFPTYWNVDNPTLLFRLSILQRKRKGFKPFESNVCDYLEELGFKEMRHATRALRFGIEIAPEYVESVKNMLDLIRSEVPANNELGYILFQNIKEYALHPA